MDDFLNFVRVSLFDWTFWVWFVIVWFAAFIIWLWGHRLLMSIKKSPAIYKIVAVFIIMALIYGFGIISFHDKTPHYGGWFALPLTVLIISTYILLAGIIERFKRHKVGNTSKVPEIRMRQKNLLLMAKFMFWIWSLGWVVYFIAICCGNSPHVGAEVLLRPSISSLHHFAGNIDSNIYYAIGTHDVLKGVISCICFTATVCTVILIMSLVMSRLIAYLHIRHLHVDEHRNHVYLFFGMNDASQLLANDICSENGDPNGVVIYVETNLTGEAKKGEEKTDAWSSIGDETTDVWETIGLTSVKQLLKQLKSVKDAELHVFLLSEDRDANVRSVPILTKDSLISCPNFKTTIYCHIRRNGVNRIVEDLGLTNESRTEVRIIDSSYLAVEQLKSEVKNHPVEFVTVNSLKSDNPGTVSSPFVSLVMGFGETGEEAVKFLYEYSAFVNEKASSESSFRSPFCCYVVDKNIRDLEGHFISDIPGAVYERCDEERNDANIKFYPYDYMSDAFFTKVLGKIAESLNYVVIALGDDELNMSVAVEILRYIRKKRANLDNFRIYVRVYEKGSFTHLKEIATHYNMRLGKDETDMCETIVLFGQSKNIYTYELVVKDYFREAGRLYYEAYRSLLIDPNNDEGTWEERQRNTMKPNGSTTKWDRMNKIRRKESQDRSNALHAQTKIRLLQKAVGEENAKDFAHKVLADREGMKDAIHYPLLSTAENKLMLNLAMCEHLRWNASHEMLGYVNNENGHVCDERTKQHNCLKLWEELDKESDEVDYVDDYKIFDYGVVETSFKMLLTNK